jgi:hypothetical protein
MFKPLSLSLALILLFTTIFPAGAFAAEPATPSAKSGKPAIILLPVTSQGLTDIEKSLARDSVAEGLSLKYEVKYGEQTDQIIEEIFKSHSAETLECDESKCYRDVAVALNAQLIGKATIMLSHGNYRISLVVYNVAENKSEMTRSGSCDNCSASEMEAKLKELCGGQIAEKGGVRWYWWVLGALVLGGAAATAGGGGGSGASSGNTGSLGTVHAAW